MKNARARISSLRVRALFIRVYGVAANEDLSIGIFALNLCTLLDFSIFPRFLRAR